MKFHSQLKCALLASLVGGIGAWNTHAQYSFDSGSDGSYGPMNITSNTTLQLPPDGKFHCTTITIASNATLKFTPNSLNTPVYLLAQGDVVINGVIDVNGSQGTGPLGGVGGPGGFAGGNPSYGNLPAGDGHGPGAGRAGNRSSAPFVGSAGYTRPGQGYYGTTNHGVSYGSALLIPLAGGSGGGGRSDAIAGMGGGGAILIASSSRVNVQGGILAASPLANEGWANFGYGSGGAIRLVAPVVGGVGTLDVNGGRNAYSDLSSGGSPGRIRIDCMDRQSLWISWFPDGSVGTVGANMVAVPTNPPPRLDLTQVAGNNVPVGTGAPVSFTLPQGASTNQTVTVQASNFGQVVPIRVVLTPDNGPSSSYNTNIDNTINPASVTVPVVVPVNVQVDVNAWTR